MPERERELNPSLIDQAPVDLGSQAETSGEDNVYLELISELSTKLEAVEAENAELKGRKTVDEVRAELLAPVVNKVFYFVVCYCVVVGVILIGDGFGQTIFHLSDTILGIISGSTAVSVIGLIGMVIGGLFGATRSKQNG